MSSSQSDVQHQELEFYKEKAKTLMHELVMMKKKIELSEKHAEELKHDLLQIVHLANDNIKNYKQIGNIVCKYGVNCEVPM